MNEKQDDFDPGFIEDKAKMDDQVAESTDQSQHSDGQSFNPFSDVGQVSTGMEAVGSGPALDPIQGGMIDREGVDPATASQPSSPRDDNDEPVPGGRGGLWACPHCDAKNKPGRDTCRSCGKSPDDQVASPLLKQLPVIVGGVVLVLIVLAFLFFGGTDTSYRPPGAAGLDIEQRVDGGRFAASGRVLTVISSEHGQRAVLLVFAPLADNNDEFSQLRAEFDSQISVKRGGSLETENNYVLVHLVSERALPDIERGDFISLAGADLRKPALRRFEFVVGVDQIGVE